MRRDKFREYLRRQTHRRTDRLLSERSDPWRDSREPAGPSEPSREQNPLHYSVVLRLEIEIGRFVAQLKVC
jgi:hypothetical protein